ncbi:MAG: hypothetical protein A2287_04320 [Candidatus Melainabacteria bacterium RIFOXYA12_FULL_32_12]|nr:MAG: hypothetical protein A2255_03655 [Candidatus Melainabacteria bacterium RIFOXYA2_FULL_32_9]OGI27227.1 MAG: hypothetical protein A2287_04320 [Candidatus Melainabacteria bacterium RIFOXYA12_FULL_32_12]
MEQKVSQKNFPRITLKCRCGNEFNVNVMKLREDQSITCQICGEKFDKEIGEKFAKALEDLYKVKYQLEKQDYPFHFSFIYKSSYPQPPIPVTFEEE